MNRSSTVLAAIVATAVACGDSIPGGHDGSSLAIAATELDRVEPEVTGFDRISSAAVLPGERLAVRQPGTVVIVRFDPPGADSIGSRGDGPNEYRAPQAVSIGREGRITVVDQDGRLISWDHSGAAPRTEPSLPLVYNLTGVRLDTSGTAYIPGPAPGAATGVERVLDSMKLLRAGDAGVDTIGIVTRGAFVMVPLPIDGSVAAQTKHAPADAWGVTADGLVWLLGGTDFAPRWLAPGATDWQVGQARDWQPVPTTAADRLFYDPSPTTKAMGLDTIPFPMPSHKGPFTEAVADRSGEIWARLSQSSNARRELVVTFHPERGNGTTVWSLPKGRHLIALSAEHLFTAVSDDDGIWTVERWRRSG